MMIDNHVAVIGVGRMGRSIIDFLTGENLKVTAITRTSMQAENLDRKWRKNLNRQIKYGSISEEEAVEFANRFISTSDVRAISDADIIIESVNEDIAVKRDIYSKIRKHMKSNAIIASNSSSILPLELTENGFDISRLIGLHFFFPVPISNVVELVTHSSLDEDVCPRINDFINNSGMTKVEQNSHNAFLLNMLSMAVGGEAFRGANKFGFDKVNELSMSKIFPPGVFSLFDHVGIPVILEATKRYSQRDPLENKKSYKSLMAFMEVMMQKNGENGLKFSDIKYPDDLPGWELAMQPLADSEEEFHRRLLYLHINTCLFSIEKGLIDKDVLDISIKTIMGADKGPLELAEEIGFDELKNVLNKYYKESGAQYYRPSLMLEKQYEY